MSFKDFQEIIEDSFYAMSQKHNWERSNENKEIYRLAFQAGGQWSARTSSQLAPHIAKFCEFMMWLTANENTTEVPY